MINTKTELRLPPLFMATLMLNAGAAFMWPLTTVYMNKTLGKSLTTSGTVLLIMSLLMIVGNYIGGFLFDHWSPYLTGLIGAGLSLAAMMTLIFFHGWPVYAIMLFVSSLGDGITATVQNSYAATITSSSTRRIFNLMYIGINIGAVIGTLLVGYLLDLGITVVFLATSVCYLMLFLLMLTEFRVTVQPTQDVKETDVKVPQSNLRVIWLVCLMIFAIYASYTLWESVLSVHMTNLHIPFKNYSLLWTLNAVLIVFGQPLTTKLFAKHHLSTQVGVGVSFLAVSFFPLIFAKQYSTFVIVMVILTLGEMIGFPGLPTWIDTLAKNGSKGKYQGMFNVALSMGRAVGPLFGGVMIDFFNYQILFFTQVR
ncbi:MDR family MFS transporter [Secundilactobacillus yichangensis]|uniref:MDR family MFS transporter n=1 Tax=Secundilactobacillus yichangensis TaxID=2799580 RepID=UPI0027E53947|nr:MFS transporter [Secundilactobacillus yichangensis]